MLRVTGGHWSAGEGYRSGKAWPIASRLAGQPGDFPLGEPYGMNQGRACAPVQGISSQSTFRLDVDGPFAVGFRGVFAVTRLS